MHPATPPAVDPSELRPRWRWYVVSGVIAAVLVLAGIGGFAYGIATAIHEGGLTNRFATGETATVKLAPEGPSAIYVSETGRAGTPDIECTVASFDGNTVGLSGPPFPFTYTSGETTWHLRYVVDVTAGGEYRVSCRPTSGDVGAALAIGQAPEAARFFGGLFGGLAALFVLPLVGLLIAATMTVVVAVKRGSHRRRLQAERSAIPPTHPPNPPSLR